MAESNRRITWEGCKVLLDVNDGDRLVFARLTPKASIKIGNKNFSLSPLVGCPYGSLFRVESGPNGPVLARCVPSSTFDATCKQDKGDWESENEDKDNRELLDDNSAQGLSSEDIDKMRREGATGDEIVDALIANSSTFGKKTAYSQEKYKLKKQKKYAPKVLLRRPSARSICEAYFKKYPHRIGFLRMDTLSLLLSMANVSAYSDVLIVDMVGGILAGAVAERLGGTGYVCNTYFGTKPSSLDIAGSFNFSNEVCRRGSLGCVPFPKLENSKQELVYTVPQYHMNRPIFYILYRILQARFSDICPHQNNDNSSPELHENVQLSEFQCNVTSPSVQKSVTPGKYASPEDIKSWKEKGFTSLIVAAPEMDVGTMVQELLPLLSYSAPFAIYHEFLQPLATCMHELQASKMAIGLRISEPWLREYQVLPSRTHPHMQMSASGGYILSGTRISSMEACNGS